MHVSLQISLHAGWNILKEYCLPFKIKMEQSAGIELCLQISLERREILFKILIVFTDFG